LWNYKSSSVNFRFSIRTFVLSRAKRACCKFFNLLVEARFCFCLFSKYSEGDPFVLRKARVLSISSTTSLSQLSSKPINSSNLECFIGVSALTEGAIISWIRGFQYTRTRVKSHNLREQPSATQSSQCLRTAVCPGERFSTFPSSRKWKPFRATCSGERLFLFRENSDFLLHAGPEKFFRPTGVWMADHYFWDDTCTKSTERRLTVRVSQKRDNTEGPRVKGSQETLLTRRPGRCRKPGNFFERKGERKRDYHEHPYWFGCGTTKAHL